MTEIPLSLTADELIELRAAFDAHYHKLSKLYGGTINPDWLSRSKRLRELNRKLTNADIQGK